MKRILISILLIFLCATIFCSDVFDHPATEDKAGYEELKNIFPKGAMASRYVQTKTIKRFKRSLKSEGMMYLDPDVGILWLSEKPYKSKMLITDDEVSEVVGKKRMEMDTRENATYKSISSSLQSVFTGEFEEIEGTFNVYFLKDGTSWSLGLIPKDGSLRSFIEGIEIKGSKSVESVLMAESSGDSVLYEFTESESRDLLQDEKELFSF